MTSNQEPFADFQNPLANDDASEKDSTANAGGKPGLGITRDSHDWEAELDYWIERAHNDQSSLSRGVDVAVYVLMVLAMTLIGSLLAMGIVAVWGEILG